MTTNPSYSYRTKGSGSSCLSLSEIRDVWGQVTINPIGTLNEYSEATGISRTRVRVILEFLRAGGTIDYEKHKRARKVNIPLITMERL